MQELKQVNYYNFSNAKLMSLDYTVKEKNYFSNTRIDLIRLLPEMKAGKVLEVGAGSGDTLLEIKKRNLASKVVGIELMEIPNSNQRDKDIDSFHFGNIEEFNLSLISEQFDAIICGDVLEHLVDPWLVVKRLSSLLVKGGVFIISVPNITEIKTLKKIFINKDFRYSDEGVLDKTHLRFFCKKNVKDLFPKELKHIKTIPSFKLNPAQNTRKQLNSLSFGLLEEYLTVQYLAIARKE